MLKKLKPRLYQETILASCSEKNCLVVLPTGMGKSIIFIMLAIQRLNSFPKSKILVLAPTKPLCEQHYNSFKEFTLVEDVVLLTGSIKPKDRAVLFKNSKIIISTPQGLENDIISKRISFEDVSLLVFDECHRAVKDYAYTWLAKFYISHAKFPRVLGLSASPGSNIETIKEVCNNLNIEEIEVRTEDDPDMKPYIMDVKLNFISVELPEQFNRIKNYLITFIESRAKELKEYGIKINNIQSVSKLELIRIQSSLQKQISLGKKDFEVLKSLSILAEILKIQYALELLETQGLVPLEKYFEKLELDATKTKVKAVKKIVVDLNYKSASYLCKKLIGEGVSHPKLVHLRDLVSRIVKPGKKLIIFNNYRDNASQIVEEMNQIKGINAELFVGQSKKNGFGLSQKKQIDLLNQFRDSKFNVIVMTSVGEEGLDIPKVDYVIFYEPVSSAIRHVQRKGRTGRLEKGEVYVLVTKGTRDEIYRWSSFRKEKKMFSILKNLKSELKLSQNNQKNIFDFDKSNSDSNSEVLIYADSREKSSRILKALLSKQVNLKLEQLEVADYILSDEVGVEFKTKFDFVDSIIDGRLINQIKDLKYNFKKPILILEGDEDIFSLRNIHPNSIRGMFVTIMVDYGIPIIETRNLNETVEMLITIARREQISVKKYFTPHVAKRKDTLLDEQLYFISSLPEIGLKLATELIKEFKTPKQIVNASFEDLKKVDKIGSEKAKRMNLLFNTELNKDIN